MDSKSEQRFDLTSWLVFALGLAIVAYSWTIVVAQAMLPTDGWAYHIDLSSPIDQIVAQRQVGNWDSPLAPDDVIVAVDDQPAAAILELTFALRAARPANWVPGGSVDYTVRRGQQTLHLSVPISRYRPIDVITYGISSYGASAQAGLILIFIPAVALIGLIVLVRRPSYTPARVLYVFGFSVAGNMVALGPVGLAELWHPFIYFSYSLPVFLSFWQITILPGLAHLLLVFPAVKRPLRAYPVLGLVMIYAPTQVALWIAFALFHRQPGVFDQVYLIILSVQAVLLLVVLIASLLHSFLTVRDPVGRAQLQWLALGLVGGFFLGAATWLASQWFGETWLLLTISAAAFLMSPICLAIAILRYRLFDIGILINRALVYGALTAILALVYFGSVLVLQSLLSALTGAPNTPLVTVLSTLAIAALFTPLRGRLQRLIDRRFYRHKYDAAQALQNFAAGARDHVELDALAQQLVGVVEDTMQPASVSLWLARGDGAETAGRSAGPAA